MSDPVFPEITGLNISQNTFTSPAGALSEAVNSVMPQKGVIQPRPGQERAFVPPSASEVPRSLTDFLGEILVNSSVLKESVAYTLGIAGNPTVDFAGGPWNPVDDDGVSTSFGRMKFGFGSGYLHFCTTTGPKTLERPDGTVPRSSGLLRMPDPIVGMASATGLGATGVGLAYGSSRAYRTLQRKPTTDGVSLLSPPSGRIVVTNRLLAAPGEMTRSGGTTVTVTIGASNPTSGLGLNVGDSFTITPGEADFPAGTYTAATVGASSFTFASAGANVSNTDAQDFDTGPRPVAVTAFFSDDVTVSTPVRLYRSVDSVSDSPSDELYLVDEKFPSALNITNGSMGFFDVIPESVISDPLYTNPQNGQGATQENSRAPLYRDITFWGDRMWYAQTTALHQMRLEMLGVGADDGVQHDDTITITIDAVDYVFTFKNAPSSSTEIAIVAGGTPSYNIQQTTLNMIYTILQEFTSLFAGNVPFAPYYNSQENQSPGRVLLQRTGEGTAFGVKVSRPESWTPALSSSTAQLSVAEYIPNGLAFSKLAQSEAVPVINRTTVGAKNFAIARVFGLRSALIALKQGDGIYAVTGGFPFNVQQIDDANVVAPDCCANFNNNVWAYTDQGILRISDSGGTEQMSKPIDTLLNEYRARFPQETYDYAFAVGYETAKRVYFYVPVDVVDGTPVMAAFVYNEATAAWTGPLGPDATCAVVDTDNDKLMIGLDDTVWGTGRITRERKGNDPEYLNYADASFTAEIINASGDISLTCDVLDGTDIEPGDVLEQTVGGITYSAVVESLGDVSTGNTGVGLTFYEATLVADGSCTIYKGYDWLVQFQPSGNPTGRKTLTRLQYLFKREWFAARTAKAVLMTDQVQAEEEVDMPSVGFGSNPFGEPSFGDPTPLMVDVNPLGQKMTNAAQFFIGISAREAWLKMRLQGRGAQINGADGPAARGK